MEFINKKYLPAAVWGLVTADAFGVPYEFKGRDSFEVTEMTGYGTHHQPPGYWSDDSSMMLATMCSFTERGEIDHKDIMERFVAWRDKGEYTPGGSCFDIGGAVNRALTRFTEGYEPLKCGGTGRYDNGNGSLMRILPIAFTTHTERDVYELSAITHANGISTESCALYVRYAENLMNGMSKKEALSAFNGCDGQFGRLPGIDLLHRYEIGSGGYVLDSLEAALWCFMTTESYRECITEAVKLGNDTDTVAAIAGGIAGIYYGIGGKRGIPTKWIKSLARRDWIQSIIDKAVNG